MSLNAKEQRGFQGKAGQHGVDKSEPSAAFNKVEYTVQEQLVTRKRGAQTQDGEQESKPDITGNNQVTPQPPPFKFHFQEESVTGSACTQPEGRASAQAEDFRETFWSVTTSSLRSSEFSDEAESEVTSHCLFTQQYECRGQSWPDIQRWLSDDAHRCSAALMETRFGEMSGVQPRRWWGRVPEMVERIPTHTSWKTSSVPDVRCAGASQLSRLSVGSHFLQISSVFFGGGTPSLAEASTVAAVLETVSAHTRLCEDAEVTLEQALQTLAEARTLCPGRVSVDVMFGIPGQSVASWERELEEVLRVCDDHVSLYQLTLERGTHLYKQVQRGEVSMPADDVTASMYRTARILLEQDGFLQYEVSNFARQMEERKEEKKEVRRERRKERRAERKESRMKEGKKGRNEGKKARKERRNKVRKAEGRKRGAHGRFVPRALGVAGREARTQTLEPDVWMREVQQHGHGTRRRVQLNQLSLLEEVLVMGLRMTGGISHQHWAEFSPEANLHQVLGASADVQDLQQRDILILDHSLAESLGLHDAVLARKQSSGIMSPSPTQLAPDLEQARPQTSGEEELQLQLAMAMSREENEKPPPPVDIDEQTQLQIAMSLSKEDAQKEERNRQGDESLLQKALEESKREMEAKAGGQSAILDLMDIFATVPEAPHEAKPWDPSDAGGQAQAAGPLRVDPWDSLEPGSSTQGSSSTWAGPSSLHPQRWDNRSRLLDPWDAPQNATSPVPSSQTWRSTPTPATGTDPFSPLKADMKGSQAFPVKSSSLRPGSPTDGDLFDDAMDGGQVQVNGRNEGSPELFDLSCLGESLAEPTSRAGGTSEAFLGPAAASLVNLDSLIAPNSAPKNLNPFLTGLNAPSVSNPFQSEQQRLTLNQMRPSSTSPASTSLQYSSSMPLPASTQPLSLPSSLTQPSERHVTTPGTLPQPQPPVSSTSKHGQPDQSQNPFL
ncbi:Radical S-adenosyl methionine domain-containing protein 1, mitochondrial [Bagarius yarrelli]|uniref:Radical S-adenosyl methionine domain-containing protein 1, mitochondrial n=1 Tax=Bagarius yarrelli TaxID=175774 RepID=A0A556V8W1_BAGYA|nr:Radical S-adenosyl methionine domain-containing protein 1, mitochondrial [Bagarius yarrelli]